MSNWAKFKGTYRGEPLVLANPFEAQDVPTTLFHVVDAYETTKMALPLTIKFKRVHPDAIVPTRKFSEDAGLDVYSLERVYIMDGGQAILRTGIVLADAPPNFVIQVWPKSGLDARLSLHTGAGIIDPNYRGEILILLKNMSKHSVVIESGDAIAQLIIVPCLHLQVEITEDIEATDRNTTGGIVGAAALEVDCGKYKNK